MKKSKKKVIFGLIIISAIVAVFAYILHVLKTADELGAYDDDFFDDFDDEPEVD